MGSIPCFQTRGSSNCADKCVTAPIFRERSTSVAMISHIMNNYAAATQFLNPGQTPVLTMDQPLYALAKQLQWRFPNLFGEDKYVIILGGLHTEMVALRTIGAILDGSGWTDALTQADIASAGTCEGDFGAVCGPNVRPHQ